jgi:UDP-N-acetylglucosamine 1-carboxyvinyltransferase
VSALNIEGGRKLSGRIEVEGNKNAALPLLAACLLTSEECVLTNVPRIRDVDTMARLLIGLGATVDGIGTSTLHVRCEEIKTDAPDAKLVGMLRGSVLLLGPLVARHARAQLAQPGGDFPARRTISTHVAALVAMGARVTDDTAQTIEAADGLHGARIYLEEASVTGTETAILAAVAARGETRLRNVACEPHVVELCRFLRTMGADIAGGGTPTITIGGGVPLHGATYNLDGDYIEAGSWGVVAAVTGGPIDVIGARGDDMEVIAAPLIRMGVRCTVEDGLFRVEPSKAKAVRRLTTGLWPGFPSDLVSLLTVLATQADGRTLVHDWMYELRLFALEQLSAMRADLFLCDPHRIIVTGPTRLRGRALDSRDIRSGMALIAAALSAEGHSRLAPLETVERGYSRVVERLQSLGAQVEIADARRGENGL